MKQNRGKRDIAERRAGNDLVELMKSMRPEIECKLDKWKNGRQQKPSIVSKKLIEPTGANINPLMSMQ